MPETALPTIEQDIAQLEKQLQEKKDLLEHQVAGTVPQEKVESGSDAEKKVLKTILGEKINQQAASNQSQLPVQTAVPYSDSDVPSYLDPVLKEKVDKLVSLVFSTSLEDGIKAALQENNPALIDAFHDILTDQLYTTLLERKKVEKVE